MNISLEITKKYKCDVLVIGGGVSGFSAAVNSARNGASVILAEKNGYLGGTATAGLIGTFMTCYDAKAEKKIIKGFYSEFVDELVKNNGAVPPEASLEVSKYGAYRYKGHFGVVPYDIEVFKRVSERMCQDAGVKLLYHMLLVGCDKTENKITKAYFATNSGIYEIEAKVFIDTTGEAYLCDKAGFKTEIGDADGEKQPSSMFFTIKGVDDEALQKHMETYPDLERRFYMKPIAEGIKTGEFPCHTIRLRLFKSPSEKWHVNMTQEDDPFNQHDSEEVTNAEISQRKQIEIMMKFLKKYIPQCKDAELVETGAEIGIREGRRILGEYTLTKADIVGATIFEDAICYCANSIDIHCRDHIEYIPVEGDTVYTIPYRSLVVKECDNVLVAGRCLSADRVALSAVRVMPPCFAMGEAAGVAASIAVRNNIPARDVDYNEIREKLLSNGAYLGE